MVGNDVNEQDMIPSTIGNQSVLLFKILIYLWEIANYIICKG